MVVNGVSTSIDVDIDDLLMEMSDTEKVDIDDEPVIATCVEVYGVDFDSCNSQEDFISRVLEKMPPYELKKALCNALCVDNYNHESMLREKLEKIIMAK